MLDAFNLLYVEDDTNDSFFFLRSIEKLAFHGIVHIAHSGQEAQRYLQGEQEFADRNVFPLPDLIISDLKMPGMTGAELLRWVRLNSLSPGVPFFIFSSSALANDREEAMAAGAHGYYIKPSAPSEWLDSVSEMLVAGTKLIQQRVF